MIGAFAYGWPMMKDPVAGVQPIEYMLGIPESKDPANATAKEPAKVEPAKLRQIRWNFDDCKITLPRRAAGQAVRIGKFTGEDVPRMRPLATPLMTAGMSARGDGGDGAAL